MEYPFPLNNHRHACWNSGIWGYVQAFTPTISTQASLYRSADFFLRSLSSLTQHWICRKIRSELSLEDWQLGWGCLKPVTMQSVGLSQEVTSQSCKVSVFQRLYQTVGISLIPWFFRNSFFGVFKKTTTPVDPIFFRPDVWCFSPGRNMASPGTAPTSLRPWRRRQTRVQCRGRSSRNWAWRRGSSWGPVEGRGLVEIWGAIMSNCWLTLKQEASDGARDGERKVFLV